VVPDRGSDLHDQERAVDHQQQGQDGEAAAQFAERTGGGNDTDRAQHDRNLEQRSDKSKLGSRSIGSRWFPSQ